MYRLSIRISGILFGLAAVAALGLGGCRQANVPKTYPVKGQVVFKGGDARKLAGGYVRLRLISDPNVVAVGEIEEDGSFVLGTFHQDKPLAGVREGEYQVRVDPPLDEQDQPLRIIHPRFLDFEKSKLKFTVQAGAENSLPIEVEKP